MLRDSNSLQQLSGSQEVPPVSSAASGTGDLLIGQDGSVTGGVVVSSMTATAAHIHLGAAGTNGPVIVPFTKVGANRWAPTAGARLTAEQYRAYRLTAEQYRAYLAGNLYVNVHSDAYKGGEIRAQLKP